MMQRTIDDALELAVRVVAEADGRDAAIDHGRAVALARGLLAHSSDLTTYVLETAMRDGKPTRGGLLRAVSGIYDEDGPLP